MLRTGVVGAEQRAAWQAAVGWLCLELHVPQGGEIGTHVADRWDKGG